MPCRTRPALRLNLSLVDAPDPRLDEGEKGAHDDRAGHLHARPRGQVDPVVADGPQDQHDDDGDADVAGERAAIQVATSSVVVVHHQPRQGGDEHDEHQDEGDESAEGLESADGVDELGPAEDDDQAGHHRRQREQEDEDVLGRRIHGRFLSFGVQWTYDRFLHRSVRDLHARTQCNETYTILHVYFVTLQMVCPVGPVSLRSLVPHGIPIS